MKQLIFVFFSLVFSSCAYQEAKTQQNDYSQKLNPLIGNAGLSLFQQDEKSKLSELQKVKAHLTFVHDYLVEKSQNYPYQIKKKRIALLNVLAAYIEAESFPENVKYPGRRPCFIDNNGTFCAVGYLVKETAGEALALKINERHQYSYIYDMDLAELDEWIANSGFSKTEIAMIQPAYDFNIERKQHTVALLSEFRNGDVPNYGLGYYFVRYRPQGARLGGYYIRSFGAVFNVIAEGEWSATLEAERTLMAIKKINLALVYGFGARMAHLGNQSYFQGVPLAGLNYVLRMKKRPFIDLGLQYQYAVPLINQDPFGLNRHAFVFRVRTGIRRA